MTTVADLLAQSLKDAQVIGEGETASAETTADAFDLLNQMLSLWQTDNLYVYGMVETSFSPTGAVSYTVGAAGTVVMARPDHIEFAFYRSNSLDYPLQIINTFEEYESLCQKTQAGEPQYVYYRPSYTLGTLYVYPQPSTGTIHLVSKIQFPTLATTGDTITLPPEYILPMRLSLTELLCATFHTPISPDIARNAASARKLLKRNNVRIPELGMPADLPSYQRSNIISG